MDVTLMSPLHSFLKSDANKSEPRLLLFHPTFYLQKHSYGTL